MKVTYYAFMLIIFTFSGFLQACNFECTYKKHIKAINEKDFLSFETTITNNKKLPFILPNGKYFDDAQTYRKILKEWFNDDGWTFDSEIIHIDKTSEMGTVLLHVNYDEKDRNGKPYHLEHYLYLVFKKEADKWLLVHDQNTKISPE